MDVKKHASGDINTHGGGETPPCTGLTHDALPEVQKSVLAENSQTGVSTRNALSGTGNKQSEETKPALAIPRCEGGKANDSTTPKTIKLKPKEIPHWYALRVTYGREKKAYDYLVGKNVEAYHPTITTIKIVDGKRKSVEESRLPNIFFAVAAIATVGLGSYKAYDSYTAANMSENDLLLAKNVLALTDPGIWDTVQHYFDSNYMNFAELKDVVCPMSSVTSSTTTTTTTSNSTSVTHGNTTTTTVAAKYNGVTGSVSQTQSPTTVGYSNSSTTSKTTSTTTPNNPHMHKKCISEGYGTCDRRQQTSCAR